MTAERTCPICSSTFRPRTVRAITCSAACSKKAGKLRERIKEFNAGKRDLTERTLEACMKLLDADAVIAEAKAAAAERKNAQAEAKAAAAERKKAEAEAKAERKAERESRRAKREPTEENCERRENREAERKYNEFIAGLMRRGREFIQETRPPYKPYVAPPPQERVRKRLNTPRHFVFSPHWRDPGYGNRRFLSFKKHQRAQRIAELEAAIPEFPPPTHRRIEGTLTLGSTTTLNE